MSDEDTNWDGDFEFLSGPTEADNDIAGNGGTVFLSGVSAHPDEEENWDDDFDIDVAELGTTREPQLTISNINLSEMAHSRPTVTCENSGHKLFSALNTILVKLNIIDVSLGPAYTFSNNSNYIMNDFKYRFSISDAGDSIEFQEEIKALENKLEYSSLNNDYASIGNLSWQLGLLVKSQSAAYPAMSYFETAYSLLMQFKKDKLTEQFVYDRASIHYQMGLTALILQDVVQSERNFKLAIKYAVSVQNYDILLRSYLHMAFCLFGLEQWLNALDFYHSFLCHIINDPDKESLSIEEKNLLIYACLDLSECAYHLKQYLLARNYLDVVIRASKNNKDSILDQKTQNLIQLFDTRPTPDDGHNLWEENSSINFEKPRSPSSPSTTHHEKEYNDMQFSNDPAHSKDSYATFSKDDIIITTDDEDSWDDFGEHDSALTKLRTKLFLPENIEPQIIDEVFTYKLVPERDINVITVKYPKPSQLYSIKTGTGRCFLSETELETWLGQLASRHCDSTLTIGNFTKLNRIREEYLEKRKDSQPFTLDWCQYNALNYHILFLKGETLNCWEAIVLYFKELETYLSNNKNLLDFDCLAITEKLVIEAGKLWTEQRDDSFRSIIEIFSKSAPLRHFLSKVILYEVYVHHNFECKTAINGLIEVYDEAILQEMTLTDQELKCFCREIQALILSDLDLYINDRSMLTTQLQSDFDESFPEYWNHPLCNEKLRNQHLQRIYPTLSDSIIKIKAALALGLFFHFTKIGNDQAEKIFFEAVYMLDRLDMKIPLVVAFQDELGTSCLICYAHILNHNYKYKYALSAFHAALSFLLMQNKTNEYYYLLRQLAKITQQQADWIQAIDVYTVLCDHYIQKKRTNEVIYVYEILCNMNLEMGYFEKAINMLNCALQMFPDHRYFINQPYVNPKNITLDREYVRLQIQSIYIMIHSYHWHRSLKLLQRLLLFQLPNTMKPLIYELIIRILIKKCAFSEANIWIRNWQQLQTQHKNKPKISVRLLSSTPFSTSLKDEVVYYELTAKNYFYSDQCSIALESIDKAISLTNFKSYNVLGKLYFLRGQILKRKSILLSNVKDLTSWILSNIGEDSSSTNLERFQQQQKGQKLSDSNSLVERPGDLLQECISTYRLAYYYFKAIGDDWRISLVTTDLAEAYLEYLFWPVASEEFNLSDLLFLPLCPYSPILTRNPELASYLSQNTTASKTADQQEQPNPPSIDNKAKSFKNAAVNRKEPPIIIGQSQYRNNSTSHNAFSSNNEHNFNTASLKHDNIGVNTSFAHNISIQTSLNTIGTLDNCSDFSPSCSKLPSQSLMPSFPTPSSYASTEYTGALIANINSSNSTAWARSMTQTDTAKKILSSRPGNDSVDEEAKKLHHSPFPIQDYTQDNSREPINTFVISIASVENAAKLGLKLAVEVSDILSTLKGYLNMAELRLLQGKTETAIDFFLEFKKQLRIFFIDDSTQLIINESPPSFLQRIYDLVKRAVRLIFFLPNFVVNNNLDTMDMYLHLERDIDQQKRRPMSRLLHSSLSSKCPANFDASSCFTPKKSQVSLDVPTISRNSSTSCISPTTSISNPTVSIPTIGFNNHFSNAHKVNSSSSLSNFSSQTQIFNSTYPSIIWGLFYYLKQQRRKYSDGKITREELQSRSHLTLNKLTKLASVFRSKGFPSSKKYSRTLNSISKLDPESDHIKCWRPTITDSLKIIPRTQSISNSQRQDQVFSHGLDDLKSTIQISKFDEGVLPSTNETSSRKLSCCKPTICSSYEELVRHNIRLINLIYVIQIDNHIVHYVPCSGQRRIQKIGTREQVINLPSSLSYPNPYVFIKIHLLEKTENYLTLAVPSMCTLNQVLEYLVNYENWYQEDTIISVPQQDANTLKRKGFFSNLLSSGSRSASSSSSTSTNFSSVTSSAIPTSTSGETLRLRRLDQGKKFFEEFSKLLSLVPHNNSEDTNDGNNINVPKDGPVQMQNPEYVALADSISKSNFNVWNTSGKTRTLSRSFIFRPSSQYLGHLPLSTTPNPTQDNGQQGNTAAINQKNSFIGANDQEHRINLTTPSYVVPISALSLALCQTQPDSHPNKVFPLRGKMHKPITQCFSKTDLLSHSPNKPIPILLYLSAHVAQVGPFNTCAATPINFTGETTQYIQNLVATSNHSSAFKVIGIHNDNMTTATSAVFSPGGDTSINLSCYSGKMHVSFKPHYVELQELFTPLLDILPCRQNQLIPSLSDHPDRQSFWFSFIKALQSNQLDESSPYFITRYPLILIATKHMHSIPWELVMSCFTVVRYFHLGDAIQAFSVCETGDGSDSLHCQSSTSLSSGQHSANSDTSYIVKKDKKEIMTSPLSSPTTKSSDFMLSYAFYYSQCLKQVLVHEGIRTQWILQDLSSSLNMGTNHYKVDYSPTISGEISPLFPFGSLLVHHSKRILYYQNKYKGINFINIWDCNLTPHGFMRMIGLLDHRHVFLFSYADLLEMSTYINLLVRSSGPKPTMLFIPAAKFKLVVAALSKMQNIVNRIVNSTDGKTSASKYCTYQILMATVKSLTIRFNVPIVCINPPACID